MSRLTIDMSTGSHGVKVQHNGGMCNVLNNHKAGVLGSLVDSKGEVVYSCMTSRGSSPFSIIYLPAGEFTISISDYVRKGDK